jgi:hypothetical protein
LLTATAFRNAQVGEEFYVPLVADTSLGRFGWREDLALLAGFLASYFTGPSIEPVTPRCRYW